MKRFKLIEGLASLTEKELEAFKRYVDSPFFNTRPRLTRLLALLLELAPDFATSSLTPAYIGERLYPDEDFNQQRMREQFSFLYRLLKGFFRQQELAIREDLSGQLLLTQLRKRNLERAFSAEHKAWKKKIDSSQYRDVNYHWSQFQLATEAFGQAGQDRRSAAQSAFQAKMDHLDAWYAMIKLRESAEMLNRNLILNADFTLPALDDIAAYLRKSANPFADTAPVRIYEAVIRLLRVGNEETYLQLVQLLDQHADILQPEEARAMYKHAQNFCIRQINAGKTIYADRILRLYRMQLENGLIYIQGQLAHTDYKNIVTVGIRQNAFEWVAAFMEANRYKVVPEYRDNVYHFSLASLKEATGHLDEAIRLLQEVHFTDAFYDISARHLLIRCYYQQEDWESLYYLVEAFRLFLNRHKSLSTPLRTNHLNFLRYFLRLLKLSEQREWLRQETFLDRFQSLEKRLKKAEKTARLPWLRERLTHLKEKGLAR